MHDRWKDEVRFVDVLIRQAHPGPGVAHYGSQGEKQRDAERYVRDERISWTVLVDELAGRTHQVYGNLADPIYLIDVDGRVAFYNMWAHAPTLHRALEALRRRGYRGVVEGGVHRTPHAAAAMTAGWRGLQRGLPQSYIDIETAAPGMGAGTWLGYQLSPVLSPLTQRGTPLPASARVALASAALLLGAAWWQSRRASTTTRRLRASHQ